MSGLKAIRIMGRKKGSWMEPADKASMLVRQGGVCAICGGPPRGRWAERNVYCVDHCHKTGKIRGLLCGPCNTWIGAAGDSAESVADLAARALRYLRASES